MREMKDSGVPWIGEIPKGWSLTQLKHIVRCLDGKRVPVDASLREVGPYPYWGAGSITDWVNSYLFDEELVLLGEDGAPFFDPFRPVAHLVNGKIWVNNHIHVLKPKKSVDSRYLVYWLNIVDFHDYINGSILSKLTQSNMDTIRVCLPSLPEQQRIADSLDAKCMELDFILENTRASIEEYKKLKQSVITEAVTKGIRGERPMKDSGVEWIGEIPAVWMVCRIKHVLTPGKEGIKIGPFGSALTNNVEGEGPFKIYGQWNIVNKDFSAGKNYVSKETFESLGSYMVFPGDVLISMMGTIGKCAIIPNGIQPGIMDSHVIKARLNKSLILDRYFELVFDKDNSTIIFEQMQKGKKGSIMDGLNSSIVKNLVIPCPPIAEQQEIAAYLDEKCAAIDSLIASKEALITELEAYKKSLIYEYVTGKKEVI